MKKLKDNLTQRPKYKRILSPNVSSVAFSMSSTLDYDNVVLELCEIKSDEKVVGKNMALQLEVYHQQLSTIAGFAPRYDSKIGVKANGFRTFVKVRKTSSCKVVALRNI